MDASAICPHCGMSNTHVGPCPRIKAIEYYSDGTVKRVEYRDFASVDAVSDTRLPKLTTTGQGIVSGLCGAINETADMYTRGVVTAEKFTTKN